MLDCDKIVSLIRNECYNYHINNTPNFYKYVLQNHIKDNYSILEVGIGGGGGFKKEWLF